MTLRTKIIVYFVALHVVFAAAAIFVIREKPLLLFAIEALFVVSILISVRVVRALFVPLDLIRSGAELISERDFTTRFVPVGQPEMDALIAIYNDMIDRLRDERLALEERHQLLSKLVAESPAGVIICDFEGNPEQMNPAAQRVASSDFLAEIAAMHPGESLLVSRNARRFRVQRASFHDRGFAKSFFLIEELTEELRLSEKAAYGQLIHLMSHEVNNSVASVRSLLESLLRYQRDVRGEDREDFAAAIDVASHRMELLGRFMSGFAEVVRIPPPQLAPVELGDLVRRLTTLVKPDAEARAIRLTTSIDAERVISADAGQLEQALLNILRNAIEAAGENGAVDVTLRNGNLTITDTGSGITETSRPNLFTPFFTTKRDGRGIGLTVVQEVLTSHGFGFSLENRPSGGAQFVVEFSPFQHITTNV
ncbi:MAG TPA: ATP-binding protein [Thermoanaerobaculia bacterium]|nr:ATP-binding protein [Thermoanaerobaculia bacterium]